MTPPYRWHLTPGGSQVHRHGNPDWCEREDCRPVVVIDRTNAEQVKSLAEKVRFGIQEGASYFDATDMALRSLLPVAKPDEPQGLGAVVEDDEGKCWVRTSDADCTKPWAYANNYTDADWSNIAAVKVLSPGWSAE